MSGVEGVTRRKCSCGWEMPRLETYRRNTWRCICGRLYKPEHNIAGVVWWEEVEAGSNDKALYLKYSMLANPTMKEVANSYTPSDILKELKTLQVKSQNLIQQLQEKL